MKNFGIVYDDVLGEARLAPFCDLVTTAVYLHNDSMAVMLDGSTRGPSAKELQRFGETRVGATPSQIRAILESIREAMRNNSLELHA